MESSEEDITVLGKKCQIRYGVLNGIKSKVGSFDTIIKRRFVNQFNGDTREKSVVAK